VWGNVKKGGWSKPQRPNVEGKGGEGRQNTIERAGAKKRVNKGGSLKPQTGNKEGKETNTGLRVLTTFFQGKMGGKETHQKQKKTKLKGGREKIWENIGHGETKPNQKLCKLRLVGRTDL